MSEEIINKIEKEGYKENKELTWVVFNDLSDSLRHIETASLASTFIFIILIALAKNIMELILLGLLIGSTYLFYLYSYLKTRKLLKRLMNIIIKEP
jgi:hypothetical protein